MSSTSSGPGETPKSHQPFIVSTGVLSQAEFDSLHPLHQPLVERRAMSIGADSLRANRDRHRQDIQVAYGFDADPILSPS